MDRIHCNIIQDLLPLYADTVVSPESREMVERHLCECPDCKAVLEEIRESIPVPQSDDVRVLKKIKRKERWILLSPILALVLMLWIVIGEPALSFALDSRIDYGPEDCIVMTDSDGRPVIEMSERAKGANIRYLYEMNEDGTINVYIDITGNAQPFFSGLLQRIMEWDFSENGLYVTPTLGLNPPHAHHSQYPGTMKLFFDESVESVYYLEIDYEESGEFISRYLEKLHVLGTEHLMEYEVPDKESRVLLWTEE